MRETNATTSPSANGKPTKPTGGNAAVIRRLEATEETSQDRLIKKHVPAWVVSGAVHVAIIALLILILGARASTAKPTDKVINTTASKTDEPADPDLTNDDPGIDSPLEAALPDITRIENQTADGHVTEDPIGQPDVTDPNVVSYLPAGLNSTEINPGIEGKDGSLMSGVGGAGGLMVGSFNGRSAATKSRLIREGGGNDKSEQAVGLGLAWLALQQKTEDGSWVFDSGRTNEKAAATGLALLPFLAAGETHKKPKDKSKVKDYSKTVGAGLSYLMKICPLNGGSPGRMSTNMYSQGIAAMALCEAYGMTHDPVLKPYAQAAVNCIQKAQGQNGSWGYIEKTNGDTSIVGWQVQALQAAKLAKDLVVDERVIQKAIKFLDSVSTGSRKSVYGYSTPGGKPGTALTAVGLLSRYYIDGWGPRSPGMIDGVEGLVKTPPIGNGTLKDMYYYYYATQVVHFYGDEHWKNWNEGTRQEDGTRKGGMRDWVVGSQIKKEGATLGSWDPEIGWFGNGCGRLGTTAIALLTLEVYYRHLPLYKRAANGTDALIDK